MLNKPKLKQHFHSEILEPNIVYLMSEKGHSVLKGHLYTLLAPMLNGRHTVAEIVASLQSKTSTSEIYHAIQRLENQGYITESEDNILTHEAAFWSLQDVDPMEANNRLINAEVSVKSFGSINENTFINALESLKINVSETGDFTVVLTDDYLQVGLDEFNRHAELTKKSWLLVKPVGAVIWVGPMFIPGKTGCWECLAQRLRGNRQVETSVGKQKGITPAFPISRAIIPTSLQMAVNWAATETAKWLVLGEHQQLDSNLLTFDTITLSLDKHLLIKRPQCEVCGCVSTVKKSQPIILQNQRKKITDDGGHRSYSPEETLRKYQHHISPITGIVSTLPKIECQSSLINVYIAAHQFGGKFDSLSSLRQGLRHRSAGKGKTDLQSKISAFCEAIERYSGLYMKENCCISGAFSQIEAEVVHPKYFLHFSTNQYQNREAWNLSHGDYAWVPETFDEDKETEWTPVWSLTTNSFKYLPTAFCYYGYPLDKGHRFCIGDSNGCAAGSTIEEAILQGFMELVERDCVAIWWYNRLRRPAVDLHSFQDPYLEALLDFFQERNCELWVLDITNDLNIPTFAAIARYTDKPSERIMLGFGTHFDPKVGILRAVTELNQSFAMDYQRTEMQVYDNPDKEYWIKNATLKNQPYLIPREDSPLMVCDDYCQYHTNDLKLDVLKCIEIAAAHDMETLVLDQTQPDVQLNVVKVIVPGLRHFWPQFASGRLYEVPVKMGWLSVSLREEDLNPIPMFF
jgi:oxazoline/thiazoline synthase